MSGAIGRPSGEGGATAVDGDDVADVEEGALEADVPAPAPEDGVPASDDGPEAAADEPDPPAAAAEPLADAPGGASDPPAPIPDGPRRTRRSRTAGVADQAEGPAIAVAAGRPVELRLARLHLRMGQLPLARAQLEALAGRGDLDEEALLDLAEARWRTGDLAAAGEAAGTLLARGREDALALLVAAEAVAALGRPGEARRMAARALAAMTGTLDAMFAGMPRDPIWPAEPEPGVDQAIPPADGATAGHLEHPGHLARPRHAVAAGEAEGPASPAAAEAFAGGRAALARGDVGPAAVRLGVALRLDAGFAEGVLEAVGAWDRDPALALVAGDAFRLLGREAEALTAFEVARGHS